MSNRPLAEKLSDFGCTSSQYHEIRRVDPYAIRAFGNQRRNAATRGIKWNLTLWEWWTIWDISGHWAERGTGRHQYGMCRYGDAGSYSVENVYIGTVLQNRYDMFGRVMKRHRQPSAEEVAP